MSEEIIAKLIEEYLQRLREGEAITPEKFAALHSDFRTELLEVLPMLQEMEDFSRTHIHTKQLDIPIIFPEQLGEFVLQEKIGSGGMGTVFRALQTSLHREVAVKVLSPVWSNSTGVVERFEKESKLIAALHHPHIVQVFGAGRDGGYSFYVMEFISGSALDITIRRSPLEIAKLGLQAADALVYAHGNQILHRDIKPGNFLVDANGDLHLSDFGIATIFNESEGTGDQILSRDGTLRYMAPEQLLSNNNSFLADQYSLGVTLYELVTNQPIFTDSAPAIVSKKIEKQDLKPLSGIPRDLAAVIEKSISYAPSARYCSMAEMASDLRRFINGEPVKARKSGLVRRILLWSKRRPAVAGLSILAILLGIGFICALTVGYIQTKRALTIADDTLSEIYKTYADQPGKRNTELLTKLLPYYEAVAAHRREYANQVIGMIALRSGQPSVAEKAFRNTSDRYCLAESLAAQGKSQDAEAIWNELAQGRDITAVRSLRALGGQLRALPGRENVPDGNAELIQQAWELLQKLRKAAPNDPELRYLAASILSENPRIGRGENSIDILKKLVEDKPDNPAYRLLLLRLAGKIHPSNVDFDAQIAFALKQADELLVRHPNEPEVLVTAADVKLKHAANLAREGRTSEAIGALNRAIGLYAIIAQHPDAPPEGLEKLSEFEARLNSIKRKFEKSRR